MGEGKSSIFDPNKHKLFWEINYSKILREKQPILFKFLTIKESKDLVLLEQLEINRGRNRALHAIHAIFNGVILEKATKNPNEIFFFPWILLKPKKIWKKLPYNRHFVTGYQEHEEMKVWSFLLRIENSEELKKTGKSKIDWRNF